ncbi:40147_t:CDS:2 [Gigaspora margarita]|uniref:40147_t:CDS:1 n=1 Tax=Gigaspora margarita TaxID=4874 RepID=A0ABN7V1P3_GIGMA|nr:40147_t:CDS:2 [Gigaspora margarita]
MGPATTKTKHLRTHSPLNLTTYMGHMDTVWDFRLFPICTVV